MNKENVSQILSDYFTSHEEVIAVMLFGSVIDAHPERSEDVDVAVLFRYDAIPDYFRIMLMQEDLTDLFAKKVDLVRLNGASPVLKMQILKKGITVLNNDPTALSRFKMYVFSEYVDFKRTRLPIEKSLTG